MSRENWGDCAYELGIAMIDLKKERRNAALLAILSKGTLHIVLALVDHKLEIRSLQGIQYTHFELLFAERVMNCTGKLVILLLPWSSQRFLKTVERMSRHVP